MGKNNVIKIRLLASVTALIQLAAGFAIVKSNNKKIDLSADQKIEYYASEENVANQLEAVPSIETSISKAKINPPTKPEIRIEDPYGPWAIRNDPQFKISTSEHGKIMEGAETVNGEDGSAILENIDELSNSVSSENPYVVKNSITPPTKANIGEPYGPWDKSNPIYQAIQERTKELANTNGSVNPVYDKIRENAPYIDEIHRQQLYDMDPRLNYNNKPPYMAYDENKNQEQLYGYDYVTKNSPYNEIKDVLGKDNVQNNAPVDGLKEEPKIRTNPIYDKIRENTPYMDEIRKQQLYEMDPRLNPLNRPPYQAAAENIEEYNKSK